MGALTCWLDQVVDVRRYERLSIRIESRGWNGACIASPVPGALTVVEPPADPDGLLSQTVLHLQPQLPIVETAVIGGIYGVLYPPVSRHSPTSERHKRNDG